MEIKNFNAVILNPQLRESLLKKNLRIKGDTLIGRGLMFNGPVSLASESVFYASSFDAYSYVSANSYFINAKVGRFCSFAGRCHVGFPLTSLKGVSTSSALDCTSPFSFAVDPNQRQPPALHEPPYEYYSHTVVGHDVWVGNGVKITNNVNIGTGAVIAANTVVTKDVPPYAVVGSGTKGMQILKMRFSDEVIADLMASKWWEYDLPKLAERDEGPEEDNVRGFIELIKERKTAGWPRLKDNWYYLIPEDENTVHLYPVPPHFAAAAVMPIALNKFTAARQQQALLAQNRYEKTHAKRRTYHISCSPSVPTAVATPNAVAPQGR